ncbi:MAG: isoprenylcysteine carboxylmethyltransferase family protein [Dehalococcoidia bacterium]|nr:isoprenylcysteine carboxylmethyltransferase family protein [Dehalococcoidia bacterium]
MSIMTRREKIIAYAIVMAMQVSFAASMILFMVFLFGGSLEIVDLNLNETALIAFNAFLALVFFAHHSIMLHKSSRKWLSRFVSLYYQVSLFTVTSAFLLILLVILWQPSEHFIFEVSSGLRWVFRAFYFLAIGLMMWTMATLKDDLAAADPIMTRLRGLCTDRKPFIVAGPYRWIRHPFYFAMLVSIWSFPDLTADRLLFDVLATVWIVLGTKLEERDMVSDIGEPYRVYRQKVPMLIPYHIRPIAG